MIKDRLKEVRERTGMNKKEFAEHIGIKYTTYNNYETGAREPDSEFLIMFSKKFNVSTDFILGLQEDKEILYSYELKSSEFEHIEKYRNLDDYGRENVDAALTRESKRIEQYGKLDKRNVVILAEYEASKAPTHIIPYWEYGVSAGNGIYQLNDTASVMMTLWATEITKQADFIIKVSGASMEPDYHDGDKVLVDRKTVVEKGEVGIFVKNGDTYIKELGENELISRNPEFPNIPVKDFDNVVCLGKVIGILTDSLIAED